MSVRVTVDGVTYEKENTLACCADTVEIETVWMLRANVGCTGSTVMTLYKTKPSQEVIDEWMEDGTYRDMSLFEMSVH